MTVPYADTFLSTPATDVYVSLTETGFSEGKKFPLFLFLDDRRDGRDRREGRRHCRLQRNGKICEMQFVRRMPLISGGVGCGWGDKDDKVFFLGLARVTCEKGCE